MSDSKVVSALAANSAMQAKAGGPSPSSGPTGSKQDYSKKGATGASPSLNAKAGNPMNAGKPTYGVGGV